MDAISRYYEDKRIELKKAQAELEKAIAEKKPAHVVQRLRDKRDCAGYVGD